MLKEKDVIAVLPAKDLQRARMFYSEKLELDPDEMFGENLVYHVGHSKFELYETPNAGSAKNTQMSWMVDNLEDEMARMRAHGIEFEDYDVPGLKTVDGVATGDGMRSAWFRDSEGNFLCISQIM